MRKTKKEILSASEGDKERERERAEEIRGYKDRASEQKKWFTMGKIYLRPSAECVRE